MDLVGAEREIGRERERLRELVGLQKGREDFKRSYGAGRRARGAMRQLGGPQWELGERQKKMRGSQRELMILRDVSK